MKHEDSKAWFIIIAICLSICGVLVFHFFGNAVRGWVDTPSMFFWWFSQWINPDCEAQHGPLIAIISIFLFIRGLKQSGFAGNGSCVMAGTLIVCAALLLHAFGYLVQHTRISIVAFLMYLMGTAYLIGGKRAGRASLFPCMLMLFSIPLQTLFEMFSYPIRSAVIDATHFLSGVVGFDVIREGTSLFAADNGYNFDVAPACSGLRSLMAIMSLVLIVGHLSYRKIWPQVLLFLLSIVFAYIGNVVRLFSIITVAEWMGQDAGAKAHDWGGFIVFLIILSLSLATVSLSIRLLPSIALIQREDTLPVWLKRSYPSGGVTASLCCVVLLSLGTSALVNRVDRMSTANACGILLENGSDDPVSLPNILNFDWMGQSVPVSQIELDTLPEDTGFARSIYQNLEGDSVFFSIVLSGKDRTSIHRPEVCLDAQGWDIIGSERRLIPIPKRYGGVLETTLLTIERRNQNGEIIKSFFSYWFIGDNVTVSNHWDRIALGFRDRVLKFKRNRWAYVFAQTVVTENDEKSLSSVDEVIGLAIPFFQKKPTEEHSDRVSVEQ